MGENPLEYRFLLMKRVYLWSKAHILMDLQIKKRCFFIGTCWLMVKDCKEIMQICKVFTHKKG